MSDSLGGPGILDSRPAPRLGAGQLKRVALAAQGFGRPRPERPDAGHLRRTMERIALLQIDSVNVLSRSHYLPLFARLGAYDRGQLDRLLSRSPRLLVEYWAHEAAYVRPDLFRSFGWRADAWSQRAAREAGDHTEEFARLLEEVRRALREHGPLTAKELDGLLSHDIPEAPKDHWGWNHSRVRRAAELLFFGQQIGSIGRSPQFERIFALPETVHPELAGSPREPAEAARTLVAAAAKALGAGTVDCFADYFRMPAALARTGIAALEAEGALIPVRTPLDRPAWLWHEARKPRRIEAAALLSPFDSLVFNRRRLLDLFGFHYRIEIYTPAAKRRHGYYVLPFLFGEDIVARVDLKADRASGRLLVRAAWAEPQMSGDALRTLVAELEHMAGWLGLEGLEFGGLGDLIAELQTEALRSKAHVPAGRTGGAPRTQYQD